jgi:hypothetical protein
MEAFIYGTEFSVGTSLRKSVEHSRGAHLTWQSVNLLWIWMHAGGFGTRRITLRFLSCRSVSGASLFRWEICSHWIRGINPLVGIPQWREIEGDPLSKVRLLLGGSVNRSIPSLLPPLAELAKPLTSISRNLQSACDSPSA